MRKLFTSQDTKLKSAQREMSKKMLGITQRDRQRASWIKEQTKVGDNLVTIKKNKQIWECLITLRSDNKLTNIVREWQSRIL